MSRRYCESGRIDCPHLPQCGQDCHYDTAQVRKIKPYPAIPPDIEPVPEKWHKVGTLMLTGIMGVLAVVCILLFFTGFWVWSLLI